MKKSNENGRKTKEKVPQPTAYRCVCRGDKVNITSSKLLQRIETTSTTRRYQLKRIFWTGPGPNTFGVRIETTSRTSQHLANSHKNNKNKKSNFQRYMERSRGDCQIGNGGG